MFLPTTGLYRFDDFELQPSRRSLLRAGQKVAVAPKSFEVLLCLVINAGKVVLKEEILRTVWPESFVEESNLTQHIFWLRKALGDKSDYIATIPGRGYEFVAAVEAIAQSAETTAGPGVSFTIRQSTEVVRVLIEEPADQHTDVFTETTALAAPRSGNRMLAWPVLAAVAVAVIAASALGVYRYRHRVISGDHHEVVLADFENTTGDPSYDHALKALLAIDLNQSPFLFVVSDADIDKVMKLMNRQPGDDLSLPVAREVCQRLNDEVVISGLIARFDQSFLVTLTANDCVNGNELLETKAVAKSRADVLKTVDSLAAEMRRRLGEPLKTLPPPGQHLELQHTASLEALKVYSQAKPSSDEPAIPLYRRAVEIDPTFAAAWLNLYYDLVDIRETSQARDAIQNAYKNRDYADESTRLAITAAYDTCITGNLVSEVRDYENWTKLYPLQPDAWHNLALAELNLGHFDLAVAPARRALELSPQSPTAYNMLVKALFFAGRTDEAEVVCQQAIRLKLDNIGLRYWLLNIQLMKHDDAGVAAEDAWAKGTDAEAPFDWVESYVLLGEGKIKQALALHERTMALYEAKDQKESADSFRVEMAYQLTMMGMAKQGDAVIDPVRAHADGAYVVVYEAYSGRLAEATARLARFGNSSPTDTLGYGALLPIAHAAVALQSHKPAEAVVALSNANTDGLYWDKSDVPYWSGLAFLANRQPDLAEKQFEFAITHVQGIFYSVTIPLSHLGLARCYAAQSNTDAARREYQALFDLWKDADADLPPLKQARAEYAALQSSTAK